MLSPVPTYRLFLVTVSIDGLSMALVGHLGFDLVSGLEIFFEFRCHVDMQTHFLACRIFHNVVLSINLEQSPLIVTEPGAAISPAACLPRLVRTSWFPRAE